MPRRREGRALSRPRANISQQVGLGHVERSWPRELSGGMLKRVAVATVFANSPRVLLMDEPFGALDYVTKLQLHQLLLNLWGQYQADRAVRHPRRRRGDAARRPDHRDEGGTRRRRPADHARSAAHRRKPRRCPRPSPTRKCCCDISGSARWSRAGGRCNEPRGHPIGWSASASSGRSRGALAAGLDLDSLRERARRADGAGVAGCLHAAPF